MSDHAASDTPRQLQRELRAYLHLLRQTGLVAVAPGAVGAGDGNARVPWPDESTPRRGGMGGGSSVAPDIGGFGGTAPPVSAAPVPSITTAPAPIEDLHDDAEDEQLPLPAAQEAEAEAESALPELAAAPELAVPVTSAPLPPSALVVPELLNAAAPEADAADGTSTGLSAAADDPAQLDLFGGLMDAPEPPVKPAKKTSARKPR